MYLKVNDLQKYYGEGENKHLVLNHINMSVDDGSICVVMGPSGCGKSTLLHCIGGLEKFEGGEICVDGVDLTRLNDKKLLKYRKYTLGFVFQFYNLVPNLTVAENIEVCSHLSRKHLDIDELLNILGLSSKKYCFPNELSGGEQQRCAIARALVKKPELLLCDEPTGALDSKSSKEILCLLDEVNQRTGTTIIIVTHNNAIKPMAHRIITMQDGAIIEDCKNKNRIPAKLLEGI